MPVCPSCRALTAPAPACPACGHAFASLAAPAMAPETGAAAALVRLERPGIVTGLSTVQIIVGALALMTLFVLLPVILFIDVFSLAFTGHDTGFFQSVAFLAILLASGLLVSGIGLLGGHTWAWGGGLVIMGVLAAINLLFSASGDLSRMIVVVLLAGGIVLQLQEPVRRYCGAT